MSKCPIQPKEVTETYAKAGQIYADKVIALRFDDAVYSMVENGDTTKVSAYKDDFVEELKELAFDPTGVPEQEDFWGKISSGLENKFPNTSFDELVDYDFSESMTTRFSDYFDENKKLIAKKIVESRVLVLGHNSSPNTARYRYELGQIHSAFTWMGSNNPKTVAQTMGKAVALELLKSAGELLLKQAQNSAPDVETQKRYFVDTLSDWGVADNGYIDDSSAWKVWDESSDVFENWLSEMGLGIVDYEDYSREAYRETFSSYFNEKMGTKLKTPKQGRTPFLMAKGAFKAPSAPQAPNKKVIELTEKSRQILDEYAKTRNLDLIFDGAENMEQEQALLDESLKLPR